MFVVTFFQLKCSTTRPFVFAPFAFGYPGARSSGSSSSAWATPVGRISNDLPMNLFCASTSP